MLLRFPEELKPSTSSVLEEDEGFSDWSHRLENRPEQEVQDFRLTRRPAAQRTKEEGQEPEHSSQSQEHSSRPPEKVEPQTLLFLTLLKKKLYDSREQVGVGLEM